MKKQIFGLLMLAFLLVPCMSFGFDSPNDTETETLLFSETEIDSVDFIYEATPDLEFTIEEIESIEYDYLIKLELTNSFESSEEVFIPDVRRNCHFNYKSKNSGINSFHNHFLHRLELYMC